MATEGPSGLAGRRPRGGEAARARNSRVRLAERGAADWWRRRGRGGRHCLFPSPALSFSGAESAGSPRLTWATPAGSQAQPNRPGGAFARPARPARRVSERGFRYRAGMRPIGGGAGRRSGAPGLDRLAALTGVSAPSRQGACPECPRCGSRCRHGCPASLALAVTVACEMPLPRDAVLPAPAQRAQVCRASRARGKFGSACSVRPCRASGLEARPVHANPTVWPLSAGCSCCSDGRDGP